MRKDRLVGGGSWPGGGGEVHAGAGVGEEGRLMRGVVTVDCGAVHIALGEAHDLTALEVDGRKDDEAHGRHSRNFASIASP